MKNTSNLRIAGFDPLIAPNDLLTEQPLGDARSEIVSRAREDVRKILAGEDDRLIVVVGPCSVHDPGAAVEYAGRLGTEASRHAGDLLVVMRVYFEKPRTTVGWKGLINDPNLDGSYDVHTGLQRARQVLLDVLDLGLPVGCEFLDPTQPQYIADAVAWGAIGARTTESQVHRQLVSGLSMPVGFKNGTDGGIQIAIDACGSAAGTHVFFGVDDAGRAAVVTTTGNPHGHVILRGGRSGPNYEPEQVATTLAAIHDAGLPRGLIIDASHDNSAKDHTRQPIVAGEIGRQVSSGEHGIVGVMLESFLVEGRQRIADHAALTYGQSITDACMGWETTVDVLGTLAAAVRDRRTA